MRKLIRIISICFYFFSYLSISVYASSQKEDSLKTQKLIDSILLKTQYTHGEIVLPGGLAKMNVPQEFGYLNPDQAKFVLEKVWQNPPSEKGLGMLFPSDLTPISPGTWGIEITYSEDGHVKDDDASEIKYDELLKQIQEAMQKENPERVKQGYSTMDMVGWAEQPSYDKNTHKLYWAKELKIGSDSIHTLNYNVRILGRKGVLVLNAIALKPQLTEVKNEMQKVIGFVNFEKGNRYEDFDSKTDKVAEYGIAALILGGVAAKAGLFKIILGALVAGWKFIVMGVAALGGFLTKLFKRKKDDSGVN